MAAYKTHITPKSLTFHSPVNPTFFLQVLHLFLFFVLVSDEGVAGRSSSTSVLSSGLGVGEAMAPSSVGKVMEVEGSLSVCEAFATGTVGQPVSVYR